jgi:DNA-binding XRE family transcriptional regulator
MIVWHLREWRMRAALTQQQLANRAGLDRRTVVNAEQHKPSRLTTVQRLATALGVGTRPWLLNKPPPE